MLYTLRAWGVIFMILSPSVMKIVGPEPGVTFLCAGFGLLLPDIIPDLHYGRGEDVPHLSYDPKSPSSIAWEIIGFVAVTWLMIGLLASLGAL